MAEKSAFFASVSGHVVGLMEVVGDFEYLGVIVNSGGVNLLCICRRQVKDSGANDRKFVPVDYMDADGEQVIPQGFLDLFGIYRPRTPQNLTQVRELLRLPARELHDAESLNLMRMRNELMGSRVRVQD